MATCSLGSACKTKGCIFHDPDMKAERKTSGVSTAGATVGQPAVRISRPRDAAFAPPPVKATIVDPDPHTSSPGDVPGTKERPRRRRSPREFGDEVVAWLSHASEVDVHTAMGAVLDALDRSGKLTGDELQSARDYSDRAATELARIFDAR